MNDGLIDAFRHHIWAMRELLGTCRGLTDDQAQTTVPGTYGSIVVTFWHTIRADSGYCGRLTGDEPTWRHQYPLEAPPTFQQMAGFLDEMEQRWEDFLSTPFDAERLFTIPWHSGGERNVPAGIWVAQALHHGTDHRSQICTALSSIGIEPPGMGVWEYAEATGRAKQVTA